MHLNPRWGRQRLRAIKKAQVEAWIQEIEDNESVANSTGANHWKVFQMIMKDALQNGKITSNPTYEVDEPYVGESTSYVFSPDECWAIYDTFPVRYRLIPMFGFGCGNRQAEAFGVCDDVIDSTRSLLTVRRQALRTKETRYKRLLVERLKRAHASARSTRRCLRTSWKPWRSTRNASHLGPRRPCCGSTGGRSTTASAARHERSSGRRTTT